jgi:hypothetical protein
VPHYLRADVSGTAGDSSSASQDPLWWPPSKISGRWLAPYLALNEEELAAPQGIPIEADLTAVQLHSMIGPDRHDISAARRAGQIARP